VSRLRFCARSGREVVRRAGSSSNVASEHKWPDWVTPPVLCGTCGERVRISKDAFFQSFSLGTFHAACAPYATNSKGATA